MGRIRTRVSAVLIVYDSYQNKKMDRGRVSVITKQGVDVVHKEDGSLIFLEKQGVEYLDIEIRARLYQSRKLSLGLSETEIKTVNVRLDPIRQYPFNICTTYLSGKIKSGTRLSLVLDKEEGAVRLTADCQAGDKLLMVSGLAGEAPDRQFRISDKENGNAEFVKLLRAEDKIRYGFSLTAALQHSYKRGKCSIQTVYPIKREADGTFFAAMQTVPGEGCEALLYSGDREIHRLHLRHGADNVLLL